MRFTQRLVSQKAAGRVGGAGGSGKHAGGKRPAGRLLRVEPLEQRTVLSGWLANSYGVGADPGNDIALDGNGNVYVCGDFNGTTNFTPTQGSEISLTSDGTADDAFVAKLNPNGEFLWARRMGGTGDDWAAAIAVSDAGVYVAGVFHDTATFGSTQLVSAGYGDIFVAKLDASGDFQWAVRAGGPDPPDPYIDDFAGDIALGPDGAIYLAGSVRDAADFDGMPVSSQGRADAFLAKLTDNGTGAQFEWVQTTGTENNDIGREVGVGTSSAGENIYLGAEMADRGRIVRQYSPGGIQGWEAVLGGGNYFKMTVYQADPVTPYLYVGIGDESGDTLAKLDSSGGEVWRVALDVGSLYVSDLAADGTGLYATGTVQSAPVDFDPDPSRTASVDEGQDAYIWKLGHDGRFLAARGFGAGNSSERGRGIVVLDGNIYTTGSFDRSSALFDTGTEFVAPTDPQGNGAEKMFVLKTTQEMGGIFGQAFNDLDGDGVWDVGEPPLAGFSVSALAGDTVQATTVAGTNGEFSFPHLAPNTSYDVQLDLPAGWTQTADGLQNVTFAPGEFASSTAEDYLGAYMPSEVFHYESADVPTRFPNRSWQTANSTLTVSDSYPILGVEIRYRVTGIPDTLTLIAPDGTRFQLPRPYSDNGVIATNAFNYQDAMGTWTLEINPPEGSKGQLTAWSLDIRGGVAPPVPGITVEPTSGLVTTEGGGTGTFTVALDSLPSAPVTIGVSSSDLSEGTVSTASLVFDSGNWSTPQTVTVTGVDDQIEDGNVAYTVVLAPAVSTDSGYNGLDPADVAVTNLDDDASELFFQSIDVPKTIADPHPKKGARPTASQLAISGTGARVGMIDVDVTIVHPSMSDLTVTLASPDGVERPLFFVGGEWNLTAMTDFWGKSLDGTWVLTASDHVGDGVTGTLESWSITASTLNGPGVTVTPTSGLSTTEAGGTASFFVILNSQPTGMVRVHLYPTDTSEGRLEKANSDDQTLDFDPDTWDDPQEVVVAGVDDSIDDGDVWYQIVVEIAECDDPDYWLIDPDDVEIANVDDDDTLLADFDSTAAATGVTSHQVEEIASEALAMWSARLGALVSNDIRVAVADLAPGRLGEAHGQTIVLDTNANGAGWFVDETPWEHSEFARLDSPAYGRVDLLTVTAHEIGHVLGFAHSQEEHDLMAGHLGLNTRRLPGGDEFTLPLASCGSQALDEVFAAFGQMEAAKRDSEDRVIAGTDNELLDLLALTHV